MATAINIDAARQMAFEEMTQLKERIIANMQAQGAVASGKTIRSLQVVAEGDSIALISAQQMPFGTLETGRRGGAVPSNFVSIIMQWLQDKGIKAAPIPYKRQPSERWQPKYTEAERGQMSLAGAIAHTIRKSGTKLFREGGRDTIYSQEIPKTIEVIQTKISALLQAQVAEQIKLNTK